ncbi:MAG: hypothetical protein AAFZ07_05240 [Actinomycetota bacterium]
MDQPTAEQLARTLWQRVEPYHAITYFAEECLAAFVDAGLRGFWRGYFAGRAAPFGAVEAGPIVAAFHGFRADFVQRAVPSIWSLVTPSAALQARLDGADRTLRRVLELERDAGALDEIATLLTGAMEHISPSGRPVFAANADLERPDDPHLAAWHAATLLREHRGDGHVVALTDAGLDGCEPHVLRLAIGGLPESSIAPFRGWDADDWAEATDRLRARGWLDADGAATDAGHAAHRAIEAATDRLAAAPVLALGDVRTLRLIELLDGPARRIGAAGVVPYPNAMGVPPPDQPGLP